MRDNRDERFLVILDSISVGLRCLTGNPRAKNRSRGLFSVHEGRTIDFLTRPTNLANPDDEFQIVFRQLSGLSSVAGVMPFPWETSSTAPARSSTPRSECSVMRAHVKNAMEPSDFVDLPVFTFFHSCYAFALSQDLFKQFHRRRVSIMRLLQDT